MAQRPQLYFGNVSNVNQHYCIKKKKGVSNVQNNRSKPGSAWTLQPIYTQAAITWPVFRPWMKFLKTAIWKNLLQESITAGLTFKAFTRSLILDFPKCVAKEKFVVVFLRLFMMNKPFCTVDDLASLAGVVPKPRPLSASLLGKNWPTTEDAPFVESWKAISETTFWSSMTCIPGE